MSSTAALESVADRLALVELVSRLGRWLDEPASADPVDLLDDAVIVRSPGGVARGRDAVVAQARRTHDAHVTQHLMTDVIADVLGDEAQITSNLLVSFLGAGDELAPAWQSGSRYRFEARRTHGGWRLTSIEVAPVWQIGERPVQVRPITAAA